MNISSIGGAVITALVLFAQYKYAPLTIAEQGQISSIVNEKRKSFSNKAL
jgi:Na+/H+-translocating membrane pyrophosphatase